VRRTQRASPRTGSSRTPSRAKSVAARVPAAPRSQPIRIALPKGRLLQVLAPIFARAGLPTDPIESPGRRLVHDDPRGRVRYFLLKPDDVPTYVEHGACDVGIVGQDVLLERGHDLYCPLDLGVGRCRIVLAAPAGSTLPTQPRIATKYLHVAQQYCASRGVPAHFIALSGSVEIAPGSGLADAVVDIVETGETLRQHHLEVKDTLAEVTAVLVVNRTALKLHKERIASLITKLRRSLPTRRP
jgi:ATP phosphoribosyltransferase